MKPEVAAGAQVDGAGVGLEEVQLVFLAVASSHTAVGVVHTTYPSVVAGVMAYYVPTFPETDAGAGMPAAEVAATVVGATGEDGTGCIPGARGRARDGLGAAHIR